MKELNNICLKFSPYLAWQIDPNEEFVYIFNIKTNEWICLDGISKDIWLLINNGKYIYNIINELTLQYNTDINILKKDILEFIDSLLLEGLVIENE